MTVLNSTYSEALTLIEGVINPLYASAKNSNFGSRTVTLTQAADLAGLGAGVKTFSKNIGAVLPSNARIVGRELSLSVAFSGGGVATGTVSVTYAAGASVIVNAENVLSTSGYPKQGTSGAAGYPMASASAAQLVLSITADVDLNTLVGGSLSATVCYQVV